MEEQYAFVILYTVSYFFQESSAQQVQMNDAWNFVVVNKTAILYVKLHLQINQYLNRCTLQAVWSTSTVQIQHALQVMRLNEYLQRILYVSTPGCNVTFHCQTNKKKSSVRYLIARSTSKSSVHYDTSKSTRKKPSVHSDIRSQINVSKEIQCNTKYCNEISQYSNM